MCDSEKFKRNRYVNEGFMTEFDKIECIENIIRLDTPSIDSFEIYIIDGISRDFVVEVINEITNFDNFVQDFSESSSKNSVWGYKNYCVGLAWMSIEDNKVKLGYWGEYVNIELRAIFIKNKDVWENETIHFQ